MRELSDKAYGVNQHAAAVFGKLHLTDDGITAFYSENPERRLEAGEIMTYYGQITQGFEYPEVRFAVIAESDIFKQFDKLRSGKTTLFVSHRLSSATAADEIIVMQGGKILEQGDHKELMKKQGAYYSLFTLQAEKYLENS